MVDMVKGRDKVVGVREKMGVGVTVGVTRGRRAMKVRMEIRVV